MRLHCNRRPAHGMYVSHELEVTVASWKFWPADAPVFGAQGLVDGVVVRVLGLRVGAQLQQPPARLLGAALVVQAVLQPRQGVVPHRALRRRLQLHRLRIGRRPGLGLPVSKRSCMSASFGTCRMGTSATNSWICHVWLDRG